MSKKIEIYNKHIAELEEKMHDYREATGDDECNDIILLASLEALRMIEALKPSNTVDFSEIGGSEGKLTESEGMEWISKILLPNGEYGEHWTLSDVENVAKQYNIKLEHINLLELYVTMNMIYSDHYTTVNHATSNPQKQLDLYVALAKDFLFDKDSKYSPSDRVKIQYLAFIK